MTIVLHSILITLFATATLFGQSATVKGKVYNTDKEPIPNTVISISNNHSLIASTVSDSIGDFKITFLPAGSFDATANATGYEPVKISGHTFHSNQISFLDILMGSEKKSKKKKGRRHK